MNTENDYDDIDKNRTDKDALVFFRTYVVKYDGKFAYHVKFKTRDD